MKTRIKTTVFNDDSKMYQPQYKRVKHGKTFWKYIIIFFPIGIFYFFLNLKRFMDGNYNAFCPYKWENIGKQTQHLPDAQTTIDQHIFVETIEKQKKYVRQKNWERQQTKETIFIKYP